MRVVRVEYGTFMVDGEPLAHRGVVEDGKKTGLHNLCKRGETWELYYTASGTSQAVQITDGRVREAMRALLDWHRAKCRNCVQGAPGQWDLCAEAQELLAGS